MKNFHLPIPKSCLFAYSFCNQSTNYHNIKTLISYPSCFVLLKRQSNCRVVNIVGIQRSNSLSLTRLHSKIVIIIFYRLPSLAESHWTRAVEVRIPVAPTLLCVKSPLEAPPFLEAIIKEAGEFVFKGLPAFTAHHHCDKGSLIHPQ